MASIATRGDRLPSSGCMPTAPAGSTKGSRAWLAQVGLDPDPPGVKRGLISDFESGQVRSEFGAGWSVTSDGSRGGTSIALLSIVPGGAGDSSWALAVSGDVYPASRGHHPYAGALFAPGSAALTPVDLSSKAGLAFAAKGDGKTYDVLFFTKGMIYASGVYPFRVDSAWQRHWVPFSNLPQLRTGEVTGIWFGSLQPGSIALQLDDIELF